MNTVQGVQWMLTQLDIMTLRSCARSIGLRPRGCRAEVSNRIMHRYASPRSPERQAVFQAVRNSFMTMPQPPVVRHLRAAFDAAAAAGSEPHTPLIPVQLLWPSLFS